MRVNRNVCRKTSLDAAQQIKNNLQCKEIHVRDLTIGVEIYESFCGLMNNQKLTLF